MSLELVSIPTGSFMMGDASLDPGNPNNHGSLAHTVAISNAFHIGKFEVTQAQWMRIMGAEPITAFTQKGDTLPVENAKWYEARNFCTNLDARFPAYHFRLPTEAEWQYACRAGSTTRYFFGDVYDGLATSLASYAWFGENAGTFQTNGAVSVTRPVGARLPNAWGLYDMHGNVSEYTHSLWARYPYDAGDGREATDGIVGTGTEADSLVLAGGGDWHHAPSACAVFSRSIVTPGFQRYYFGFRVVMVPRDLAITLQPAASQAVSAGSPAVFSVAAASASPIGYQWRKNGVNIAGATNATYTIPVASAGDAATYRVVAANLSGVELSAPAQLTVNAVPVITSQPVSQGALTNTTPAFSVTAAGSGLRYQWYKNGGTLLSGATNASHVTPATTLADSGTVFYVVVSNALSGVTSSNAVLTVTDTPVAPAIVADPAGQDVLANLNQPASFRMVAVGTALAYQWTKDGSPITGKTSPELAIANPQLADGGAYRCQASNALGIATSAAAILTVTTAVAPVITVEPVSQSVLPGQDATFSVAATGSAPLAYQWQTYVSGGWPVIPGATGSSYTVFNTWNGDNGLKFRVTVSNPAGSTNSAVTGAAPNFEPMLKNKLPVLSVQPASWTGLAAPGQTVDFKAELNHLNTPPLVFELLKNGVNTEQSPASVTYDAPTKYYKVTFTTSATNEADNGDYVIRVSNTVGCVSSQVATLTVTPSAVKPVIVSQSTGRLVVVKTPNSLSVDLDVKALGTATMTYQWTRDGTNINQANSSVYTLTGLSASNEGVYAVRVGNTAGSVTSAPIPLLIRTIPWITTQPTSQIVSVGQPAVFNAQASGSAPLAYQWFRNGAALGGETGSVYILPSTLLSDSGSVFKVRVSNMAGMEESGLAILNLAATNEPPAILTPPTNQTVAAGQTATFSVTASGTAPLFYQWLTNGVGIDGATGPGHTTGSLATTNSGTLYAVVVSNLAGCVTSVTALLTVLAVPEVPVFSFADSFETYALGAAVNGTNGWSGPADGAVVTALVYKAKLPPGFPIPGAAHSRVMHVSQSVQNALSGPSNQNVNVDFMLQPTNGALSATLGQTVQLGLAVDTQGVVQVWHSWYTGSVWTQRWTALAKPPGTGQWVRIGLSLDYTNNPAGHTLFRPLMNGIAYATATGVADPTNLAAPGSWYVCADSPGAGGSGQKRISGFKIESDKPSRLDDVVVTAGPFAFSEPPLGVLFMIR